MGTWPNRVSREPSWRKFRDSSAKTMEHKKKKRILVVNDHEDNIELLRPRLEAHGKEEERASERQTALDAHQRTHPDRIPLMTRMTKRTRTELVKQPTATK